MSRGNMGGGESEREHVGGARGGGEGKREGGGGEREDGVCEPAWVAVEDASEEVLLLWSLRDPISAPIGSFVAQGSLELVVEVAGQRLRVQQSPSCLRLPGVTGSVMWDSGVVLAKALEHMCDSRWISLRGKRCVELGAGCGLVGCAALLLGASHVVLTDQPDRLRLLRHNVADALPQGAVLLPEGADCSRMDGSSSCSSSGGGGSGTCNVGGGGSSSASSQHVGGVVFAGGAAGKQRHSLAAALHAHAHSKQLHQKHHHRKRHHNHHSQQQQQQQQMVAVESLVWGEDDEGFLGPPFDFVLGSDVVYCEDMVRPLLCTIAALCGAHTTVFVAGELRNDAVVECFLEAALEDFDVSRAESPHLHPEFDSRRIALFRLRRRSIS